MSANVQQMFSVRKPVWWQGGAEDHGQAAILSDYPQSWDEARKLAGLDWEPVSVPAYGLDRDDDAIRADFATVMLDPALSETERANRALAVMKGSLSELSDFQRIVRSDTNATLALPKDSYAIIGHGAFGEILEAVLQTPNVKLETAGCLDEGRAAWALAVLDEPIVLPGDKTITMPYVGLTARHDGTGALTLRATMIRIVCQNTFRAAEMEGERTGATYSFIHTKNWNSKQKFDEAREAIRGARREITEYTDLALGLLGIRVTPAQRDRFIIEFIPAPPAGLASDRVLKNVETARDQIRKLIAGPTITGAEIEGTAYGLVQAAGEYLDHVRRSNSWETRLGRTLLRPEPLKSKAMQLAREVANA